MILAIDAGNTRTKWGVFDAAGERVAQGVLENTQLDSLAQKNAAWAGCCRAVVSNVAGVAVERQLRSLLDGFQLPALWVKAEAAGCGVTNGYTHPGQLGPDRWAALLAAWNRYREPCVVATAGTALTVDALSAKVDFLAGLIVPGLHMMQAALAAGTAALPLAEGNLCEYPTGTAAAIYSGGINAMAGAVERMRARL
ncbi:MAG TPA: type III pantothenate kinase, partial [Methylophilaceae bacterium]|nr:type III pantothenate kinase [Methylophilaceae bacterium]